MSLSLHCLPWPTSIALIFSLIMMLFVLWKSLVISLKIQAFSHGTIRCRYQNFVYGTTRSSPCLSISRAFSTAEACIPHWTSTRRIEYLAQSHSRLTPFNDFRDLLKGNDVSKVLNHEHQYSDLLDQILTHRTMQSNHHPCRRFFLAYGICDYTFFIIQGTNILLIEDWFKTPDQDELKQRAMAIFD